MTFVRISSAYQSTLSAGLGRYCIDDEETKLTAQIGAGYRSLRPETLVKDALGEVNERIPGERSSEVESGSNNALAQNEIALQVKMTEVLALAVGFTLRNNSNPPVGLEETDTLTTVNLVYEMR